jgi:hypothetical protein
MSHLRAAIPNVDTLLNQLTLCPQRYEGLICRAYETSENSM